MQGDNDLSAVSCQRLVHRVIDDLVNQMVQTALVRGADVHARTLAHSLKALEHLNLVLVIGLCHLFLFGQLPDVWSFVGYAVIIAMAIVNFIYNNRRFREE